MEKVSFELRTKLSFGESGKEMVQFSKWLCVLLANVFMEGGRLFQKVWAVCWKEWSEIVRVDMCGYSIER